MIPLRDSIPRRTFPLVTIGLIAANVFAFFVEVSQGRLVEELLLRYAFVPDRFFHPATWGGPSLATTVLPVFSSMFLHGGIAHLAGNLLFLWIFGDNLEDELGHGRFLLFYLACGAAATLAQGLADTRSIVPTIGASGAIAGVLGGYLVLFPRARIVTLVPLFVLFPLVELPAVLYLLLWFLFQFLMGSAGLASGTGAAGGVAYWAHIGGFVAGLLTVGLFRPRRRPAATYRLR